MTPDRESFYTWFDLNFGDRDFISIKDKRDAYLAGWAAAKSGGTFVFSTAPYVAGSIKGEAYHSGFQNANPPTMTAIRDVIREELRGHEASVLHQPPRKKGLRK